MIVVGLVVAFLGKKLVKPTIFVIGTLASISILGVFIFGLSFSQNSSETIKWVVFGVICVVGLALGLLLAYLARIGAALLSAWGGVVLGMMLYASFIVKIDNENQVGYWVTIVLLGVVAGIIGYFLYNHAIIIATGIIGSYLFIRGISLYAGGYPNEVVIIEKIKNGFPSGFPPSFYGYLAGFAVLTIISIVFQYKMWFGKTKDSLYDHPYHKYRK
jgi:drug/metabolite transporter (DMT)-like permease